MVFRLKPMGKLITFDNYLDVDRTRVLHGSRTQIYEKTNTFGQLFETKPRSCTVLRLKPRGKLIIFYNYLSVRQNQGLAWSSNYKPMRKSALGA